MQLELEKVGRFQSCAHSFFFFSTTIKFYLVPNSSVIVYQIPFVFLKAFIRILRQSLRRKV